MATNQYLPFATGGGANVLAYSAYNGLAARTAGFTAGTALSINLNSVWRQGSIGASVIGQFVGDIGGFDALDDGSVTNLLTSFERTLQNGKLNYAGAFGGTANVLTATLTPTPASIAAGFTVRGIITTANTGAMTLNVGTGAIALVRRNGGAYAAGDLSAGQLFEATFNGTSFVGALVSGGLSINRVVITSSTTYTPSANLAFADVEVIGGGGGGGGGNGSANTSGSGGGEAGRAQGLFTASQIGASQSVTIGAGGTAGPANSSGGTGGTTAFGSLMSATGGTFGTFGSVTSSQSVQAGFGGSGVGGDVQFNGADGFGGPPTGQNLGGHGGGQGGGQGAWQGASARAGRGYGGGGGGGYNATNGAAGFQGVCIITEYIRAA